jgi:hypothetical protein
MKRYLMGMGTAAGELEAEINEEEEIVLRFGASEVISMTLAEFRQVVFWVDFIEQHKLGAPDGR